MKSLRNFGLAVVLSLGASQVVAMDVIPSAITNGDIVPKMVQKAPQALVESTSVVAPVLVKSGFWKSALESVKSTGKKGFELGKKTFTKENAGKVWTSTKNGVKTGFNATVEFGKKYGKKGIELVKNNKKTTGAIVAGVIVAGTLVKLAHKYSWLGKAKAGIASLFAKKTDKKDSKNQQGQNKGNGSYKGIPLTGINSLDNNIRGKQYKN